MFFHGSFRSPKIINKSFQNKTERCTTCAMLVNCLNCVILINCIQRQNDFVLSLQTDCFDIDSFRISYPPFVTLILLPFEQEMADHWLRIPSPSIASKLNKIKILKEIHTFIVLIFLRADVHIKFDYFFTLNAKHQSFKLWCFFRF